MNGRSRTRHSELRRRDLLPAYVYCSLSYSGPWNINRSSARSGNTRRLFVTPRKNDLHPLDEPCILFPIWELIWHSLAGKTTCSGFLMKVVGRRELERFARKHADVRGQIDAWLAEAEEAEWESTTDIKKRYAHASFLANNRVIFNLKGNSYR